MTQSPANDLHQLAAAVGLQREWRDVEGRECIVADEDLNQVLLALGYETGNSRQIRSGLERIARDRDGVPQLVVTEVGQSTPLPITAEFAELTDEQGRTRRQQIEAGALAPIGEPGYYDLAFASSTCRLAVAPARCPLPVAAEGRLWGSALQIPALRGAAPTAFGGLGELAEAIDVLAKLGCQAVAINPVHALFPGVGEDFSPYSPSSRTYLNSAIAEPALLGLPSLRTSEGPELIDWAVAIPDRQAALRESFAALPAHIRYELSGEGGPEDPGLDRFAVHEALFCHFRAKGARDWRDWPAAYRGPGRKAVQRFAAQHADEIAFHRYAQRLARQGLAIVQQRARAGGMAIGLIADLAVGVHPGGSDCWASADAMLSGLTIGAPPDPLGPLGQNWSITGYSPAGLRATGYQPWIDMLRSALRSAGGLRIDHAFGLARLWVIPAGGECADGAYLTYPFLDLVRLAALEAHRACALIIAEDLGTAPPGFTRAVSDRDMLGMRVLWFERAADHGFIGAHDYPAGSVALTGTHDTPTVAGWWQGRDLDWAAKLCRLPEGTDRARAEEIRDWDRGLLWSTIGSGERPAPDDCNPVVEAAIGHIAKSPALIAISPIEDLLGEPEQPNLPGTTIEHPNWRRRMKAPIAETFGKDEVIVRAAALSGRP